MAASQCANGTKPTVPRSLRQSPDRTTEERHQAAVSSTQELLHRRPQKCQGRRLKAMGPMDDPQKLRGNLAPASRVHSHMTRDSQVQNHDALTRCHTVSPPSGDNQWQEHFPQPARASCQQGRCPTVAPLPTNAPQIPFQLGFPLPETEA